MSTAEPDGATAPAGAKEPARRRGFRFAVATFFLIALISAVTQLCILGSSLWFLLDAGPELWPSGGFVALVSGVAMWIWCPNWASWRKWVWLPVVVAVIVAVVTVYLVGMGHTLDADQRIPRICARLDNRLTELEQQRVDLLARVEARAEVLSRQRQASGSHLVDPWINSFGEDARCATRWRSWRRGTRSW